jgi:hypothetical protein
MEEVRNLVKLWDEKKIINCDRLHHQYRDKIKWRTICCQCKDDIQRAVDDLRIWIKNNE